MERGKSLGGLVESLVDEVAIRGKAGVSQDEVTAHVRRYHSKPSNHDLQAPENDASQFWLPSDSQPTLDGPYLHYVWKSLIRHPEIHIDEHEKPNETTSATETDHVHDAAVSTKAHSGNSETTAAGSRVFASESQVWRTIAGHEPDSTRVPGLDFVLLSIIASCGPKGIPQHELIRISGQDKRSLPNRTDRLAKGGYIIKHPVDLVVNSSLVHTSILVLTRFAESSEAIAAELTEEARERQKDKKSQKRRLKALRKAPASSKNHVNQGTSREDGDQVADDPSLHDPSIATPVPQWTPNRNILNQIFDVINRFGPDGATTNDIFGLLMGYDYRKPIEELLNKLTSAWQLSQPSHLRHLAIVRDSVQKNRNQVYIHYTFEHYKQLVEHGQKSWEAIISLQDKKIVGDSSSAHLDRQTAFDEYGFPKLDPSQFTGENNDGSLRECVPLPETLNRFQRMAEPLTKKIVTPRRVKASKESEVTITDVGQSNSPVVKKARGRPPKFQGDGNPANFDSLGVSQIKGLIKSRSSAEKYQRKKITAEIDGRIEAGNSPYAAAHDVLKEIDSLRKDQGEEPLPTHIGMQVLHLYAGGEEFPENPVVTSLQRALENKKPRKKRTPKVVSILEDEDHASFSQSSGPLSLQSVGKRKRRFPKAFDDSLILPGAAIKRPRTGEKEDATSNSPPHWHLPSVAAHFHPLPFGGVHPQPSRSVLKRLRSINADEDPFEAGFETPSKRARLSSNLANAVDDTAMTSLETQSPAADNIELSEWPDTTIPRPSGKMLQDLMAEKYAKAVDSMPRPSQGVFLSKFGQRNRRRDDPPGVKTIFFQMAVFKLTGLRGLDWFIADTPMSPDGATPHVRAQELTNALRSDTAPSVRDPGQEMRPQSIPISNRDNTTEVETNASIDRTIAVTAPPTTTVPEADLRTQFPEALGISAPTAEALTMLDRDRLNLNLQGSDASGEPSPLAHADILGASESVSVVSIIASTSQTNHGDTQSTADVEHNTPTDNAADFNSGAQDLETNNTTQLSSRPRESSQNHLSRSSPKDDDFNRGGLLNTGSSGPALPQSQEGTSYRAIEPAQAALSNGSNNVVPHDTDFQAEEPVSTAYSALPTKPSDKEYIGKRGGSTALLRRNIVMDIVGKCRGVYPDVRAMRIPFEREWKARGQSGLPDRITVGKAVNLCCEQGKLRRIVFTFKDSRGITATSTIFAVPEIDTGDPKVTEMQELVKQHHPITFVPEGVLPKDSPQVTYGLKRQQAMRTAAEKKSLADEAKSMASRSQEEREAYISSLQASDRTEKEIKALSRLVEPSRSKVERLISIRKPLKAFAPLQAPNALHAVQSPEYGHVSNYLLKNYGSERMMTFDQVTPSSGGNKTPRPLLPATDQMNQFRAQDDHFSQRESKTLGKVVSFEEDDSGISPSSHSNNPDQMPSDNNVDKSTLANTNAIRRRRRRRRGSHAEDDDHIFPGFMDPVQSYHRATGTFSASFPGFRIGLLKSNNRGKRPYRQKALLPIGYSSPFPPTREYAKFRFPGVVGYDIFHSPSGTFSAIFLGFPRKKLPVTRTKYVRRKVPRVEKRIKQKPKGAAVKPLKPLKPLMGVDENDVPISEKPSKRSTNTPRKGSEKSRSALDGEDESPTPLIGTLTPLRRIRGPQMFSNLGEDGALRLFVAVTVVRVLTGGVRRYIDWALVAQAFMSEYEEDFLRKRWGFVLSKMRHHQGKMDTDFRTLFVRAYEDGSVPQIDYDHLDGYDWKWLVEWTMKHLDTPAISAPHLLADRSAFDSQYALKDDSQEKDLSQYFELEGFSVAEMRNSVINRHPFTCPLFPKSSSSPIDVSKAPSYEEQVAVARTWIRANIITPTETYDSLRSRARFDILSTSAVEAALDSLLQEKMILEKPRSRTAPVPTCDYRLSDLFEKRLRTNIPPLEFHRAMTLKHQLDQAFETEGRVRWNRLSHDGEVMAVFNLVAHHRITIVPIDPPLNKWGHSSEGYITRKIDKSVFNFEMDLVPTSDYIAGRPLEPLPPPPASHIRAMGGYPKEIPVWYDINDELVPVMWKHALAAVLGLLAVRTGANASELQVTVRPSLDVWEIEELLQWMLKADVAEKVGENGYALREWWWMALG